MKRFSRINLDILKLFKDSHVQHRLKYTTSAQIRPCLKLEWETTKETVFINITNNQQKRSYAPKLFKQRGCWNCKKESNNKESLLQCKYCGILQDVKTDINYFDLMDFPQTFDLEAKALTKRFRQLQTVVHPDKFSNTTSHEQSNSAGWSSLINKAYKTLSSPLDRGQYILELNGIQLPQDNSALDKEFLMEMMERNEQVDGAKTRKDLYLINEGLTQELKEKIKYLAQLLRENNLEAAKKLLIEMKYLIRIQKSIKNKLQILLTS